MSKYYVYYYGNFLLGHTKGDLMPIISIGNLSVVCIFFFVNFANAAYFSIEFLKLS